MLFYIGKHRRWPNKWEIMTYGLMITSGSIYSVVVLAFILEASK